jgi:hypothetical protein
MNVSISNQNFVRILVSHFTFLSSPVYATILDECTERPRIYEYPTPCLDNSKEGKSCSGTFEFPATYKRRKYV